MTLVASLAPVMRTSKISAVLADVSDVTETFSVETHTMVVAVVRTSTPR